MSNPARELLAVFESWAGADGPIGTARKLDTASGLDTAFNAMSHLRELKSGIESLHGRGVDTAVFDDAWYAWLRTVLAYPKGFASQTSTIHGQVMRGARLDVLASLAIVLDGLPAPINSEQARSLSSYLTDIIALLKVDSTIDDALRRYIFDLVSETRRALDLYETSGKFDAKEAVSHLWVSLLAAQQQSKGRKREWSDFASKLRVPVTAGILTNLPTLAIEAIQAIQAIQ